MKKLFLLMTLSAALLGCDKLKKAENATDDVGEVNQKTSVLLEEIKSTNEAVRLQKMSVCLEQMLSDHARERIFPVPTGLMACAKVFAEAATAKEITDFTFLMIKEINEVNPMKKIGEDGMEIEDTPELQYNTMVEKFRKRQMLYALSGFLPETTVDQIISEQRFGGARRPTMLNILMMRVLFTQQIFVEDQYLKTDFETVGQAQEAVKEMQKVEKILRLPFRNELHIKTTGITTPDLYDGPIANANNKMDTETLKYLTSSWSKIASYAEEKLAISERSDTDVPAENKRIYEQEQAAKLQVIATAKAYAKGWENLP